MNDDERFAEFVRTRSPALYRYAYLLTGSTADGERAYDLDGVR